MYTNKGKAVELVDKKSYSQFSYMTYFYILACLQMCIIIIMLLYILTHWMRILYFILARNSYLTHAILLRLSCEGCTLVVLEFTHMVVNILGNPGVTHSVPTAFIVMNAVGTEWVTPGIPRMGRQVNSLLCQSEVIM